MPPPVPAFAAAIAWYSCTHRTDLSSHWSKGSDPSARHRVRPSDRQCLRGSDPQGVTGSEPQEVIGSEGHTVRPHKVSPYFVVRAYRDQGMHHAWFGPTLPSPRAPRGGQIWFKSITTREYARELRRLLSSRMDTQHKCWIHAIFSLILDCNSAIFQAAVIEGSFVTQQN